MWLNSRMIALSVSRLLMCCLVTDGGGALILTSAEAGRKISKRSRSISSGHG